MIGSVSEQQDQDIKRTFLIDIHNVHIPILKSPFIIGKIKSIVDHSIQNDLVSRIHCQIIHEEEKYYIIDLESTNGTLLNSVRLNGHKRYLLEDGDKISITNEQFTFKHI
jgi:pSer/pThr/pTyr-binding forkhead associated (FHA) protein